MLYSCRSISSYLSNLRVGKEKISRLPLSLFLRASDNLLATIAIGQDGRDVRRGDLSPIQTVPVHFGEPHVTKDILAASVQVSKSFRQIGRQEVLEQVPEQRPRTCEQTKTNLTKINSLHARFKVRWVADLARDNLLVELDRVSILCVKWRMTR